MMSTILNTLLIIDALVIVFLVIVLQHGNEGGIGSSFGGGNASGFFGASGGVGFIAKATWVCGVLFFVLALSTSWFSTHEKYATGTKIQKILSTPSATQGAIEKAEPTAKEQEQVREGALSPFQTELPVSSSVPSDKGAEPSPAQSPSPTNSPTPSTIPGKL
ncbi:MAG: preprotein translocase subunit SecG [Silvanigrellaceae bacterium]|nr:preprotein translocase subunit SecG [Silvanigrellaceae bacterium]